MHDPMTIARSEATQQVASAILKAAGGVLQTHGNDPQSVAILAAGLVMTITSVTDTIGPTCERIIFQMLKERSHA